MFHNFYFHLSTKICFFSRSSWYNVHRSSLWKTSLTVLLIFAIYLAYHIAQVTIYIYIYTRVGSANSSIVLNWRRSHVTNTSRCAVFYYCWLFEERRNSLYNTKLKFYLNEYIYIYIVTLYRSIYIHYFPNIMKTHFVDFGN